VAGRGNPTNPLKKKKKKKKRKKKKKKGKKKKASVSLDYTGDSRRGANQNRSTHKRPDLRILAALFSFRRAACRRLSRGEWCTRITRQDRGRRSEKQCECPPAKPRAASRWEFDPGVERFSGPLLSTKDGESAERLFSCAGHIRPRTSIRGVANDARLPWLARTASLPDLRASLPETKIRHHCAVAQMQSFRPRPLSEGPDPPPSSARIRFLYYPGRAQHQVPPQIIETVFPETDKPGGSTSRWRPVAGITHIHGVVTAGKKRGIGGGSKPICSFNCSRLITNLAGMGKRRPAPPINSQDGSFDLRRVLFLDRTGLMVFSQSVRRPGGATGLERSKSAPPCGWTVLDKPVEISLPLYRAVDLTGDASKLKRGGK